ncbi:MAG: glycerol-3-phosphate dehydrogenase/oxidase [Saprospiraceae bacterium]
MTAPATREQTLTRLKTENFDLVVIGGGITGAGIALDTAARGLSVALLEKHDFASGTSSKSTKLIHGGLRYLKQFEVALVREVGRERATVHRLAPHLVRPEKMLLPLVEDGSFGKIGTSLGLWVYDFLADVHGDDKRVMLSREETLEKEPLLRPDVLKGGGYYAEYRTDDARLTMENLKTARKHGAVIVNYVEAVDFDKNEDGKITAVHCRDLDKGEKISINCTSVISAAGPWVDELRKEDGSMTQTRLFLSKGVHIVVARERLPLRQAVYFDVPTDNRMIFAIPRLRSTYIGTTDTPYKGDSDNIPTTLDDVTYLLDAANAMFPTANLRVEDVESNWAGLRPLIYEEGKEGAEMSRKDEIFESESGLLSIAGGKLTGYRKMAERIVDRLADRLEDSGTDLPEARTEEIELTGGPFKNFAAVLTYEKEVAERLAAADLPPERADYLVANYGRQTDEIVAAAADRPGNGYEKLAAAEAAFCIENELALYPMDFLNRRSGRLYFDLPSIPRVLNAVVDVFAETYGYDADERAQQIRICEAEVAERTEFGMAEV